MMTNEINSVTPPQSLVGSPLQPNGGEVSNYRLPPSGEIGLSQDAVSADIGLSNRLIARDMTAEAANKQRLSGEVVRQAGDLLGKVGSALDSIVKMFPPYPHDHPDRLDILNQVSGLRQQLEALRFPPDTTDVVESFDGMMQKPEWGAIEQTPTSVADEKLKALAEKVVNMQTQFLSTRDRMWKDMDSSEDTSVASSLSAQTGTGLSAVPGSITNSASHLKSLA